MIQITSERLYAFNDAWFRYARYTDLRIDRDGVFSITWKASRSSSLYDAKLFLQELDLAIYIADHFNDAGVEVVISEDVGETAFDNNVAVTSLRKSLKEGDTDYIFRFLSTSNW